MARDSAPSGLRHVIAVGGGLAFAGSLLYFAFCYFVAFGAPAPGVSAGPAVAVNVLLFTAFAMHHSLLARTGLKSWLTRFVPASLERTTYVWVSSVLFALVCAAWQPVPGTFWRADGVLTWALLGVQAAAAVMTLVAARHLDVLELSGVRQALSWPPRRPVTLDEHGPYSLVRHPIYLAWLLLVWATPFMNGTRFAFALTSSAYLIIAIPFEERDLRRAFGEAYGRYAARVRHRLIPGLY